MHNLYKLPKEIIFHIISYTYNVQNKNLLDDIINYNETKPVMFDLYYNLWIIERHGYENEDKDWMINDLFAYANNYNAGIYGYIDNFYTIFKRNIFLDTNEKIDKYICKLEKKVVIHQINIFLGLLTIKERNDIILNFPIVNEI